MISDLKIELGTRINDLGFLIFWKWWRFLKMMGVSELRGDSWKWWRFLKMMGFWTESRFLKMMDVSEMRGGFSCLAVYFFDLLIDFSRLAIDFSYVAVDFWYWCLFMREKSWNKNGKGFILLFLNPINRCLNQNLLVTFARPLLI